MNKRALILTWAVTIAIGLWSVWWFNGGYRFDDGSYDRDKYVPTGE